MLMAREGAESKWSPVKCVHRSIEFRQIERAY
jgi:hypothetical protein